MVIDKIRTIDSSNDGSRPIIEVPNPGYKELPKGVPKDGDEMVDIETSRKSDRSIDMDFMSHGRKHNLHLIKSNLDFAKIPVKLLGFGDEEEQRVKDELEVGKHCLSTFSCKPLV